MCGIAGYLDRSGGNADRQVLDRMSAAIEHRGPDGHGVFTDGSCGLAHRRLAIIDRTEAATQPMTDAQGRYTLCYNGEVYNFAELRAELQKLDYVFRSRSDTEVVLAALATWGMRAIERFNGMFALALWDSQEQSLLLARDRYGIKPMYYAVTSRSLIFASEIKAILAHTEIKAELDADACIEYFTFQNIFTDRTLFRHIKTLQSGCTLRVDLARSDAPHVKRYWDFNFFDNDRSITDAEATNELNRLFTRAVSRQLVSDVEIGTYLSGGIDSGAIAALAARERPEMKSFTVGFDLRSASGIEMSYDERAAAEHMSYCFGTEHYEMVLKAGDMERCLPRYLLHLEDPRVGQSYPNYYAAKLSSRFVKVVLAGTGGDELFGGYPWRYYSAPAGADFGEYTNQYYRYWQRMVPDELAPDFFAPIRARSSKPDTREIFRNVFINTPRSHAGIDDCINSSLYFEAKTFLHGLLLVEDKLSMAFGLEARFPFLDNDLVDFAQKLPLRLKVGTTDKSARLDENAAGHKSEIFYQRTHNGKLLLRSILGRHVPEDIARAAKQGFSAPDASWFRGESIELVKRRILNPDSPIYECFDRSVVRRLIDDHLQGRVNRRLLIWSLLVFDQWNRTFLG